MYDFYKATEVIEIGRFVTKKSLKKYQQQNSLI